MTAIDASPSGRELFSISDDLTLRVWDLPRRACGAVLGRVPAMWCAFSGEGTLDVVWSGWRASARLFARRLEQAPAARTG